MALAPPSSTTSRPAPPDPAVVRENVAAALAEDLGSGDVTAALIPADQVFRTRVISREHAVLCGQAWFEETFAQIDDSVHVDWAVADGDALAPNQEVCVLGGSARAILSGERTALNFLQTLSGTASRSAEFVHAVDGTGTVILDTRKTLPGLRVAQKYAVRCGGARNHRQGLFDAILVKENHIAAAGSISEAVRQAQAQSPNLLLEVEVENLEQLAEARDAGAQRVLLDNFSNEMLREAVSRFSGQIGLEASGGISLDTVRAVAETGVDFISTGDITKHVRATDFSMRFV